MAKILKSGKVVILLNGRFAGKKAVVVDVYEPNAKRNYTHVLVAGVAAAPKRVTKDMSKEKLLKRSRVKTFVKFVNVTHVLPTRYQAGDVEVKSLVQPDKVDALGARNKVRYATRLAFKKAYLNYKPTGKNAGTGYLFNRLKF